MLHKNYLEVNPSIIYNFMTSLIIYALNFQSKANKYSMSICNLNPKVRMLHKTLHISHSSPNTKSGFVSRIEFYRNPRTQKNLFKCQQYHHIVNQPHLFRLKLTMIKILPVIFPSFKHRESTHKTRSLKRNENLGHKRHRGSCTERY